MEQVNYLMPLVSKCSFEYSIRNIHLSLEGLKLNQHLFFVVDVNVQGENVCSLKNCED
jgi:hypothetical protein